MHEYDTIAAVITAQGIGAMGALRISGPEAFAAAARVFRSKSGRSLARLGDYSLTFGHVYDGDELLDQALLLKMSGPKSYTGQDVAELQCHGGPLVLSRLLEAVIAAGARVAEPGEFSQRAFINGKLDLSQAEAIMDLVSASNRVSAAAAADQLEGSLSRKIRELKDRLIGILAEIEAEIDFPDEELVPGGGEKANTLAVKVEELLGEIGNILAEARYSRIYREGLRLVFYGRPNAGKSSLLNSLLQEPRAIVTAEPGTTRDTLEERILLQGIPVILTDTAGIRQAGSLAEQAGVDRARAAAAAADLILFVIDVEEGLNEENRNLLQDLDPSRTLVIINKADLLTEEDQTLPWLEELRQWHWCLLSALSEDSMKVLGKHIRLHYLSGKLSSGQGRLMLNQRQIAAVMEAQAALREVVQGIEAGVPEDMLAIDLRRAWEALGKITGETVSQALVAEIFSRFCLGK
ncbi:MAG: tRNA uridine-5-carboxymethylaminomethyl(34) synthesis GTPase MnmE [Peptococcaceae bacterium]|nr:tRNA uridine-5-carboxymethylaminomethyl(34) synthesis GTPase MnmE [Peptococcaceae bacterium]